MARILITGSGGFLGSVLVRLCHAEGHEVVGTVRHTNPTGPEAQCDVIDYNGPLSSSAGLAPDPRYVRIDLTDTCNVARLVGAVRPEIVFHLAGQTSTVESWKDPITTYRDNVLAQVNVLEACCALQWRPRVLVVGSSDEYGAPPDSDSPLSEPQELAPVSPYGVTKVAQDIMARQYCASRELWTVVARPFIQIGPGRSDRFFSGAFARQIVEIRLGTRPPVLEVGNVDQVRDMMDVRDAAAAFVALVQQGEAANAYNVSSGRGVTIRHFLNHLMRAGGVEAEVRRAPHAGRRQESRVMIGDCSKLTRATDWRPTIELEASARDMISDWLGRLS